MFEGTLVLVSGLSRTQCGSGACLASPSGVRATTSQRRNLELDEVAMMLKKRDLMSMSSQSGTRVKWCYASQYKQRVYRSA